MHRLNAWLQVLVELNVSRLVLVEGPSSLSGFHGLVGVDWDLLVSAHFDEERTSLLGAVIAVVENSGRVLYDAAVAMAFYHLGILVLPFSHDLSKPEIFEVRNTAELARPSFVRINVV